MYDPRAQCSSQYLGTQSLDIRVRRGFRLARRRGSVSRAPCRYQGMWPGCPVSGVAPGSRSPPRCGHSSPQGRGSGRGIGITALLPASLRWHLVLGTLVLVLWEQQSFTEVTKVTLSSHVVWDSQSNLHPKKNQPWGFVNIVSEEWFPRLGLCWCYFHSKSSCHHVLA